MSLRSSFSDLNKTTSAGLKIRYKVEPFDDADFGGYLITRTAAKSYSYISMTETAAHQCAAVKIEQYMRPYSRVSTKVLTDNHPSNIQVYESLTDVATVPDSADGYAWRVDIAVNETDIKWSETIPVSPAALFADENARNYDEGTFNQALSLASAEYDPEDDEIAVVYSQDIRDFDPTRVVAQIKADPSDTAWSAASFNWILNVVTTSAVIGDSSLLRLCYGDITTSPVVITLAAD